MPLPSTEWTADMVRALPEDGKRHEVLDGELVVSPAPSWMHQYVVGAFFKRLDDHVAAHRLGRVLMAPADVEFSARRLLQPDLRVVPLVGGRRPRDWESVRRLQLAVEVLSPSTTRTDRLRKRRIYLDEGVPEYWIVHPEGRLLERWRPGSEQPQIVDATLTWEPVPDTPPLVLDLDALFAEVLDDG